MLLVRVLHRDVVLEQDYFCINLERERERERETRDEDTTEKEKRDDAM